MGKDNIYKEPRIIYTPNKFSAYFDFDPDSIGRGKSPQSPTIKFVDIDLLKELDSKRFEEPIHVHKTAPLREGDEAVFYSDNIIRPSAYLYHDVDWKKQEKVRELLWLYTTYPEGIDLAAVTEELKKYLGDAFHRLVESRVPRSGIGVTVRCNAFAEELKYLPPLVSEYLTRFENQHYFYNFNFQLASLWLYQLGVGVAFPHQISDQILLIAPRDDQGGVSEGQYPIYRLWYAANINLPGEMKDSERLIIEVQKDIIVRGDSIESIDVKFESANLYVTEDFHKKIKARENTFTAMRTALLPDAVTVAPLSEDVLKFIPEFFPLNTYVLAEKDIFHLYEGLYLALLKHPQAKEALRNKIISNDFSPLFTYSEMLFNFLLFEFDLRGFLGESQYVRLINNLMHKNNYFVELIMTPPKQLDEANAKKEKKILDLVFQYGVLEAEQLLAVYRHEIISQTQLKACMSRMDANDLYAVAMQNEALAIQIFSESTLINKLTEANLLAIAHQQSAIFLQLLPTLWQAVGEYILTSLRLSTSTSRLSAEDVLELSGHHQNIEVSQKVVQRLFQPWFLGIFGGPRIQYYDGWENVGFKTFYNFVADHPVEAMKLLKSVPSEDQEKFVGYYELAIDRQLQNGYKFSTNQSTAFIMRRFQTKQAAQKDDVYQQQIDFGRYVEVWLKARESGSTQSPLLTFGFLQIMAKQLEHTTQSRWKKLCDVVGDRKQALDQKVKKCRRSGYMSKAAQYLKQRDALSYQTLQNSLLKPHSERQLFFYGRMFLNATQKGQGEFSVTKQLAVLQDGEQSMQKVADSIVTAAA